MNLYAKKQHFLGRKILFGVIAIVAGIIFLNMFQVQARNSFFYVSAPLAKTFLATGKNTSGFLGSLFSFTALTKENNNLKTENQNLLAGLASMQESFNATADLTTAKEATQHEKFSLVQARIIGLDIENDTMLINQGLGSGIVENMPVISKEKVLFGKVTKVYGGFSQITLISNKKSALAVKIQAWPAPETPTYGIIKGNGNLGVYLDLITASSQINQGDTLVTSAKEGIFPKELLVGKVSGTATSDSKAFQTAQIQPFFEPKTTDNVFIITNYLKK